MDDNFKKAASETCIYVASVGIFNITHLVRGGTPAIFTVSTIGFIAEGIRAKDIGLIGFGLTVIAPIALGSAWIMGASNADGYDSYEEFLEKREARKRLKKAHSLNCG